MTNAAVINTDTDSIKRKLTPSERKLVHSVFWRSMWLMFCTSYTKQQGTTFGWTMIPYLEEIYGKGTDEFYASMARHQDFFNTTPGMSPFIFSMVISMEKERKAALDAGKPFDDSSIEAIKVALMAPFAGIGDSIYSGALRIIATGIALGFSQAGSWLGPILYALVFNIPNMLIRYLGAEYGLKLGNTYVAKALQSGAIKAFTGERHYLTCRRAELCEIKSYRNLAKNTLDWQGVRGCFPHASSNVEREGASVFAARNAVDGLLANHSHGSWPYGSWGISKRDDAEFLLAFGRPVSFDRIVLWTRADFPHDNWWVQAKLEFSDGTQEILAMEKTDKGQEFSIEKANIVWIKMKDLIQSDDPSPFPALTQIEVYGREGLTLPGHQEGEAKEW